MILSVSDPFFVKSDRLLGERIAQAASEHRPALESQQVDALRRFNEVTITLSTLDAGPLIKTQHVGKLDLEWFKDIPERNR